MVMYKNDKMFMTSQTSMKNGKPHGEQVQTQENYLEASGMRLDQVPGMETARLVTVGDVEMIETRTCFIEGVLTKAPRPARRTEGMRASSSRRAVALTALLAALAPGAHALDISNADFYRCVQGDCRDGQGTVHDMYQNQMLEGVWQGGKTIPGQRYLVSHPQQQPE